MMMNPKKLEELYQAARADASRAVADVRDAARADASRAVADVRDAAKERKLQNRKLIDLVLAYRRRAFRDENTHNEI